MHMHMRAWCLRRRFDPNQSGQQGGGGGLTSATPSVGLPAATPGAGLAAGAAGAGVGPVPDIGPEQEPDEEDDDA